jgi:hypothetical protein
MTNQPTTGSNVRFSFPVHPLLRKSVNERKSGSGVVVSQQVVGSDLAVCIKVTEGDLAGQHVHVRNRNVWVA